MRKKALLLVCAMLWAGLLAGCSGSAAASGAVTVSGSTSMERVVGILIESYREINPDVTINYTGSGSSAGIEGVLSGLYDIGLSSRPLKDAEAEAGAEAHLTALDGVAVIVHPSNPIDDLSETDLLAIFTGEIENWAQLGGADAPIAAIGREAGSGTRGAFEEILGAAGRCVYTNELGSSGDVVANTASNPNAVGYISLSAADETVKVVTIGGAEATEANLLDGIYALQRPFLLVTREDTPPSPAAQAFLDYALSGEAAEWIRRAGAVPPLEQAADD